jgi:antitoxin component HigA of HigAB toxin-antitoxin module
MINETLLNALQARMRKLLEVGSTYATRNIELRAAVARARLPDASETAEEAAAVRESAQLADEVRALRDHINDFSRGGQDLVLVAGLKEELSELENQRREIDRQIEHLRTHRHETLENAIRELDSAEQKHRRIADEAMRLREHIETLSHG